MADKDNFIHENNIGSPEKGEKSKGSKSKRKGKNRGQHAVADSTAETNKSTSVAAVNIVINTNVKIYENKISIFPQSEC